MVAAAISYEVAIGVFLLCKRLDERKLFTISGQLFKSGTSIGANLNEAASPESRKDLIHKLKIAEKEAFETKFWLRLLQDAEGIDTRDLQDKVTAIQKIINKSISTAKRNMRAQQKKT